MSPEKIQQMIEQAIPNSRVEMNGADCNFSVEVTSDAFIGLSPIARHRMVNDIFKTEFETGQLHALSIKTKLPE